jgi:hypothetical protein
VGEHEQASVQAARDDQSAFQLIAVLGGNGQPPLVIQRVRVFTEKHVMLLSCACNQGLTGNRQKEARFLIVRLPIQAS